MTHNKIKSHMTMTMTMTMTLTMTMTMTIKYYLFNIIMKVIHIESWIIIQTNMVVLRVMYEADATLERM